MQYTQEEHDRIITAAVADQARQRAEQHRPPVNLSTLSPAEKKRVWEHLQTDHPAVATILRDPHLGELRRIFDAMILVDADLLAGADHVGP